MKFTLLLGGLLFASVLAYQSFSNDVVVRLPASNAEDLFLKFSHWDVLSASKAGWSVLMTRAEASALLAAGVNVTVVVDDIDAYVAAERVPAGDDWFEAYHSYEELVQWYKDLAAAHPNTIRYVDSVGETLEGRPIPALHFFEPAHGQPAKPRVWVQGLIHAREWISGATVSYIAQQLADLPPGRGVATEVEVVIIPVVNPDGYSYTWTDDRMWRKNRRPSEGGFYGVDLNRNWNDHWGERGSSGDPGSGTYRGPAPASEREVQALSAYYMSLGGIRAGIDVHSYGQLVLWPFAWERGNPTGVELIREAGNAFSKTASQLGKYYKPGRWYETLYPSSGVAQDWFNGDEVFSKTGERAYGFTVELRPDNAVPGFTLPPDQIIPTGQEIWPAFHEFCLFVAANPLPKA